MSNKPPWRDRERETRRYYLSKGGEFDVMNRAQLAISTTLTAGFFFRAAFIHL
jgi:hypothetical protein